MGFFQQVKLLLWKNGLNVIRNPVWSLTLITWPLIIFIIVAVTRGYYPPELQESCYVSPRNLPSAGLFPFLQTLLCNTDSTCHNTSHLANPSKFTKRSTDNARSHGTLLAKLIQGGDFYSYRIPNDSSQALILDLERILMAVNQGNLRNTSHIHTKNTTLVRDQEDLYKMLEAMNVLKRPICAITLAAINTTSPNTVSDAALNFCSSNNTVLEVFLLSLNKILKEEMRTRPDELAEVVGTAMLLFRELQNETSLWEGLLALPHLYSAGSLKQMLDTATGLLTNIRGIMQVIQNNFSETAESISALHPLIAGGINAIHYFETWPGNDVTIALGDIVMLNNDSFSEIAKLALQNVRIPLAQVLFMTLDRDRLQSSICENSSNPLWLTTMCMTGAVDVILSTADMILDTISPNKVAQQALLAWCKHVAPHDVAFFKGLLHSVFGVGFPGGIGGSNISRSWHHVDTQPQNIEEELFLTVGEVVLKLSEIHPEVDMIVQRMLSVGFQSMEIATLSIDVVEEMMDNILKDSDRLQNIYLTLLANQTEASVWISQILDSATQVILKSLTSAHVTCEDALSPFQWLLSTETIKFETLKSIICDNSTTPENLTLVEWTPLIEKGEELYSTLSEGGKDVNVTLSMILSQWHKLFNSSLEFGGFLHRLPSELGTDYWFKWLPGNNSSGDMTETLLQSVFVFMVNLGEKVEASPLWPEMKSYFQMVYWVLNYRPGVTTQPANCSLDMVTLNINCDESFNWSTFVQALVEALVSPSQDVLTNCLKATFNLLQNVYGDLINNMTTSHLTEEIQGGDALSAYLINLMNKLDDSVRTVSTLSDENISNPDVLVPVVRGLLESTGLSPLLPLLFNNGSVNVSDVLDAAVKLGRGNQHVFTFNETDPTMPELERLITQFLASEASLTLSLSYVMGNTLLTYSSYFDRDEVARLKENLKPFANQTSSGIVEAILSAMELLEKVVDSPDDDPRHIILAYILQLQESVVSLYKLRRIQQTLLPDGQMSTAQMTDLHQVSTDFLNLLTPESLANLTQIGPEAALDVVIQKFLAFLPPELQEKAALIHQDLKALQYHLSLCASEENCSSRISEFFTFLDEIVNLTLSVNANVTVNITSTLWPDEYENMTSAFFSVFLSPNDATYVGAFNQTLHFIRLVIAMPNITVSQIQNALRQSNLTLEEVDSIAQLAGAANVNELLVNIVDIANVPKCFELQHNASVTARCVMGLIDKASNLLANIPALHNHTAIISLIPLIVNQTASEVIRVNFSSDAQMQIIDVLNSTLNNIKINLQMNNLSTPEIMKEIRVIEGLLKVAANPESSKRILDAMSVPYSEEVTVAYLQILQWYLHRLENVTSTSFVAQLLHPFFRLTQLQVTLQLAQTNLTSLIDNQIGHFQNATDGAGVSKIGQATIEILQQIVRYIIVNIKVQDETFQTFGSTPFLNTTVLHEIEQQIQLYLDLLRAWMTEPNVTAVFTHMLRWGNPSINISTPVKDLHLLLGTMINYLTAEQQDYLAIVSNITQSLRQAIMALEQPGEPQFEHLFAAIMEAVQSFTQILTPDAVPLPQSAQENIREIVRNSLALSVEQNLTFSTSLNLTLDILNRTRIVVQQLVPDEFAVYLLPGLEVVTSYFETIAIANGPDNWNLIILNQLKTIQNLLPPNSTAQYYVSVVIDITSVILNSTQGNASRENEMTDILTGIFSQIWQIFMTGPGLGTRTPSVEALFHLGPVLQQVLTGQADQETWHKLEKMLEAVLTTLSITQPWDNVTAVIPYFEQIIACMVNTQHAENMMTVSLAKPVVTLTREIAQSVNTSHFNLSEISERIRPAIEQTLLAAEQVNGTLECSEAVNAWEPIGDAAGLSRGVIEMWCNISLQPVLETYAATHYICPHLNMSHMDLEPITAAVAAARIVNATKSLYQVDRYQAHVMEQIIMNLDNSLLLNFFSPHSLSAVQVLSDELLKAAPMLEPCIEAMEEALHHILNNYHHIQGIDSSELVFNEAAMIVLSCVNITLDDLFSIVGGNLSRINHGSFLDMVNDAVKAMIHMKLFGDEPMVYQAHEQFLASNARKALMQKVAEMSALLASSNESGLELLTQALPRISELLRPLLSTLTQMGVDLPEITELVEELVENIIAMLRQLLSSGLFTPEAHHPGVTANTHVSNARRRREAPLLPQPDPMNDFLYFLSIDYPAMFRTLSVPSQEEIRETAHMFFSNPNLNIIMKGSTRDMPWALNSSREETIDAALGVLSFATLPSDSQILSLALLRDAVDMLPDSLPFSTLLKNMTRALASESQEMLIELQQVLQTATRLLQTNLSDPLYTDHLDQLSSQVCKVENTEFAHHLLGAFALESGQLCSSLLPGLRVLLQAVQGRDTDLGDAIFQTLVGDPSTYDDDTDWSSLLSQSFGIDTSSLSSLNINFTSQGEAGDVTVGEMLRNESAFLHDVQKHMDFDPVALQILMNTTMPTNNLQILSCLVKLRYCNSRKNLSIAEPDVLVFQTFCSMSAEEGYTFALLMTRHLNMEKLIFRMVLSDDIQSLLRFVLLMASNIIHMMDEMLPAIDQLSTYMTSIAEFSLMADKEFNQAARVMKLSLSTRATVVTMTQAMCSNGILPLLQLASLPTDSQSEPPPLDSDVREEMIDRFKIPRNATPYCMNMYLDMVNTTGGAIAWAFLKPMLMGKILFTPDTPITRAIMAKANTTLQEFGQLKRHSDEWLKSSKYIVKSAEVLRHTLPLLQNSLSNAFVRGFIEMQTDIEVDEMKKTLNSFSNMTLMLERNKHIMDQITTLSTLMVNISSCIKFDRYQGYQSAEQLDEDAQELAKDRNLYGSVIFKLPKEENSSLSPKVHYTIRMHLDNVMRTDRVRSLYFAKKNHISSRTAMRYNRAFVYLQENIDRAIIEMQTGRVTETAVQLQPFPYPCYLLDPYLEAITLVFPLMLMLAWVLFVADFVKKLVYERELGLHEYMKMMGVNPFSHFVAWFLDCAAHLHKQSLIFPQSLFAPCCFSYASQYVSIYEMRGDGIQWSNSYSSPMARDTASFGWLCWMMLIDSLLYFTVGAYIRKVFPGKFGIPAPWYFPFTASFWANLFCCVKSQMGGGGRLFTNAVKINVPVFCDNKGKGQSQLFSQTGEDFSHLPVGVALHGLTKIYGERVAIQNLNVSFYEGHVTSLLGHNGAGKTTTMSLLTGLFAPSSGSIEVYGRDMQTNLDDIRKDLGVCMQYDVLFDHMTTKEHLLLYGQIKAPHWSRRELHEQVRTILEETDMYAHRHKRVGTLSGGMKRKLSISIAFIGGSHLVVLDEPTTGVDPCSRRSIWDIVIQNKKRHTIIMSTHHLDEAEMLSDRIAFLERGGLKCCGSPFYLKDKLGQGYKLTLTKKVQIHEAERFDDAEMKAFIQAHVPEARLKEAQGGDLIYSLPPFTSSSASSYSSLLTALDANLDDLQLGGYGISDTTLEEVFLQLSQDKKESVHEEDRPFSVSETVSDDGSIKSFPADPSDVIFSSDKINLTRSSRARGMALAWQQIKAILIKRFHHSRRDYKGMISKILLPVLFVTFAMGLGSINNDLRHHSELELSPALYHFRPSYSFFSNQNDKSSELVETMMSFPGMDNSCLDQSHKPLSKFCTSQTNSWNSGGNSSKSLSDCTCTPKEQICHGERFKPASRRIPSSQIVYNLSEIDVENYLLTTANGYIRNRYGGFEFGMPFPPDLETDLLAKSDNATLSKVWFNPEGYHTMPAYLNSLNNLILRSKLPADKDPKKYAISVSSQPYFGRTDEEDVITVSILQILVAICVVTGYSITTASFSIYVVGEHHSGSKRLQHIAGISEPFYWAVNFLYDMIIYLIPVVLTIGVVAAFQVPSFTEQQNLAAVSLLLVLFGFATFPWMYLLSGVFKDPEMAFIIYVCINLFISINTIISTSILFFLAESVTNHVEKENIQNIFKILSDLFLIFPQFNFGNGLMKLARMNVEVQLLSGYGIDAYKDPFSTEVLGWMYISSIIQGVVFFALRLLLNTSLIRNVRHLILGRKKAPLMLDDDEDEDVAAERSRVSSGAAGADILQVNQLTKIYQHLNRKIYAVKRLSVGIPAGECFGLLGVNGAGKTTTFKMLTGDVSPTDGTAQIRDWDGRLVDIMECRHMGINIGYCPQVDALDNLLTGEEHLYFYARIQGFSNREIDGVVKYLLKKLELIYHRNLTTDGYSCGTRRKLSTAIALIGHPQILLLDEPSSGMDPRTKRHLWKIISEEVKGKSAVILTSHSMEECEALCGRLAIMVKGQFRCLGSLQHIKNRFGSGFTVKMYLAQSASDVKEITVFMQKQFPSTYLKDQHSSMAEYHVPVAPGGLADIFQQLETNKTSLKIKHFSVSQTTLDEVFVNFAMGNSHMNSISAPSNREDDDLSHIKGVET
ncbi:uncharacterized protein abca12 [Hippocampus comes]|uniref:uncharacterized protein abca12 n=1 Tax=Hippocampus comes TaxID=109280 RepID=UPI00094E2E1B|nr:PREDICTED: uncharacterized protein LOC109531198 [Hippocampus comes]